MYRDSVRDSTQGEERTRVETLKVASIRYVRVADNEYRNGLESKSDGKPGAKH